MICPSCRSDNIPGADVCAECGNDLTGLDQPAPSTPIEKSVMEEPVASLLPSQPLQVPPDMSVREVIGKLVEKGRNCALVVAEDRIAGIFTERDILMKVAHRFGEVVDHPVSEFMTPDPERLRPTDTVAFGLNKMLVGDYRHVPIEADGKPLGVVSVRNVLNYLVTLHPEVSSPPTAK